MRDMAVTPTTLGPWPHGAVLVDGQVVVYER